MRAKHIAVTLLGISLAATARLVVGSFVTYAPTVSTTDIQNIYIGRIVRLGSAISLLQACAIAALLFSGRQS